MRWTALGWTALGLVAGGCAPPPVPAGAGGAPTIHLLYPQPGSSTLYFGEDEQLHMRVDADNVLRFTAVVSMENIEFVPPATDPIEGQAHWHVFVDADYAAPSALYTEAEFQMEPTFGTLHTLMVRLQRNDHADLDCLTSGGCTDADVEDTFEFVLDPPDTTTDTDTGDGS